MQLSHKYEVERMELKEKTVELKKKLADLSSMRQNKDDFIAAVHKFMGMKTLTPVLLHELIDHIEVHETEGVGKKRTQRIDIWYRFVGCVEIPEAPKARHFKADTRQGVSVEYITGGKPA